MKGLRKSYEKGWHCIMNGTQQLKALERMNEDSIAKNAQPFKRNTLPHKKWWLAACIVLLLCVGLVLHLLLRPSIPQDLFVNANITPEKVAGLPI